MIRGGANDSVLLLLKGHPGSGKSTLSRSLACSLGWSIVDKDDVRSPLQCSTTASLSTSDLNSLSYEIMFRMVRTLLGVGLSVIVDCPLARRELYVQAKCLSNEFAAKLVVVECELSDEGVWRTRLQSRGECQKGTKEDHKPTSWQELQALLDRYQGCWKWSRDGSEPIPHHLIVDTTLDVHIVTAEVVKWLRAENLTRDSPKQ